MTPISYLTIGVMTSCVLTLAMILSTDKTSKKIYGLFLITIVIITAYKIINYETI